MNRLAGMERRVSLTRGALKLIAMKPRGPPTGQPPVLQVLKLEGNRQGPWTMELTDGEFSVKAFIMEPSKTCIGGEVSVDSVLKIEQYRAEEGAGRLVVQSTRSLGVGSRPPNLPPPLQWGRQQLQPPAAPVSSMPTGVPTGGGQVNSFMEASCPLNQPGYPQQPSGTAAPVGASVNGNLYEVAANPQQHFQQQQLARGIAQLNPYEAAAIAPVAPTMLTGSANSPPRQQAQGDIPQHGCPQARAPEQQLLQQSPPRQHPQQQITQQQQHSPQEPRDLQLNSPPRGGQMQQVASTTPACADYVLENAPWRASSGSGAPQAVASTPTPLRNRQPPMMPRAPGDLINQISDLSSWSRAWAIKARVTNKGEKRSFTNDKGQGQFFKVDLQDNTGEISAAFFGEAVAAFHDRVEMGRVYHFSKGSVRPGNPRYDRHDLTITFDEKATIVEAEDEDGVPEINYQFTQLYSLNERAVGETVDVAVVIFAVSEPQTFTSKSGREVTKLELAVWDDSGPECSSTSEITFWGERAKPGIFQVGSIICARGGKVTEFQNSRSLNSPTSFELDPRGPVLSAKLRELQARFEERQRYNPLVPKQRGGGAGGSNGGQSSRERTLQECKVEDMDLSLPLPPGQGYDPSGPRSVHRHTVVVTLTTIHSDRPACYPACPEQVVNPYSNANAPGGTAQTRTCNKKVTEEAPGLWRCNHGHACDAPVWRFICRGKVMDATDTLDVNLFDAEAKTLFGCSAAEYNNTWELARDSANEDDLQNLHSRVTWKRYRLKLKAQKEAREQEDRVKYTVAEICPLELTTETRRMLADVYGAVGRPCAVA
mmetsp:Transcript_3512/g.8744  ORF Transcript_3512/g.8744 Transcript_3512/m.8744 type:complete len:824 (+) Transcript_3512:67-2538(+)